MNIISISILRPVFAWILMSALIIFGAVCLSRMGVSQMPDIDFPVLSISVDFEGASPEVIEKEILEPIEERLLGVEGIVEMRSSARQGVGSIRLDFDINRNVDVALQEVQSALSRLVLPPEIDPPIIRKQNPEDEPIMMLGISADKPLNEVIKWTDNVFLDQIRFLPDVGEASIAGFSSRNLRVWVEPRKLKELDLTMVDLLDTINTQHKESAAGQFVSGQQELRVRWLGEAFDTKEFEEMRILRRGSGLVQPQTTLRLKDVARVEDGLTDVRRMGRIDGREAIFVSIRKQRGTNEVTLSENITKKVAELQSTLPEGYKVQVNIDFTQPTKATVHSTMEKLVVAGIITIVICFLFLGSLQSAVNILFSIPTSILGTFIILYFSGMTLNLFTLLALTLAISIVVDDAIMLLENIVRHFRMGKSPAKAAYDGSVEILPSATAASLSVVAIFLPVVFMSGIIGKFFFQFGIAMSGAILLSLLEAVTITPMRAAALLATSPKTSKFEHYVDGINEKWSRAYQRSLQICIKWPKTIVFSSLILFIASMSMVRFVKQEFIPSQDQNIILVNGQTPTGTNLAETQKKSLEVEEILKRNKDINNYIVSIGAGGGGGAVNSMFFPVYLKPRQEREKTHQQVMADLRKEFANVKGVRLQMRDISARNLTTGRQNPIAFNLRGPDLNVLKEKSEEMMKRLVDEGFAQDLDTDFRVGLPELQVKPNQELMERWGVTRDQVSRTLAAALGGTRQGRFTADGRRFDIRVKIPDEAITSEKEIGMIPVRNSFGNLLPLERVVNMTREGALQSISRLNRQRAISVFGDIAPGKSQAAVLDRARSMAKEVLPAGYSFGLEGSSSGFQEAFKSLITALLMGILVAYMILAVQFNSFVHPFVILVALPFSLTGAFLALWISGVSLNLFSFIGIIVLMGIAKKNSILLVEFTNQFRHKGVNVKEALLEACPLRLRPILMTSIATVCAAIPLVIGNAIGAETRKPMGLTIIGGSIVSTVFTLFVVPSLYLMMSKLERAQKVDLGDTNLETPTPKALDEPVPSPAK